MVTSERLPGIPVLKKDMHKGCKKHGPLAKLCRWLPLAIIGGVLIAWITGYSLPSLPIIALLLLCPIVCLALYLQSKETERQILGAVGESFRRKDAADWLD